MNETSKKCPMCAEEIPLAAVTCEFCGAQFEVTNSGYCQNCHQVREADGNGLCKVCGKAIVDIRLESKLIEEPTQKPMNKPEPIAQPENVKSNSKKIAAITGTILASLLCGLPGILITGVGLGIINGLLSPEAQTEELTELLAQMDLTKQEFARYSLITSGIGILLILIPIVFGILTLRKKKPASSGIDQTKKRFGRILARVVIICAILVGLGFLLVNVATPKLNTLLVVPTATSTPNITSLNAQSSPGKSYETTQQIADAINANELVCNFSSMNMGFAPIYDSGRCLFTQDERETMGSTLWINVELFTKALPPLVQKTRGGYWDSVRDSMKELTDPDENFLTGPNWFIHGKLSALIEAQKILGGDILNLFSDSDRQIYITR